MKLRFATIAKLTIAANILLLAPLAFADALRGTLVHEESIRVAPHADAAKLVEVGRGHELIILETSRDWVHVQAILRQARNEEGLTDEEAEAKTITGWVAAKGLVS